MVLSHIQIADFCVLASPVEVFNLHLKFSPMICKAGLVCLLITVDMRKYLKMAYLPNQ